MRKFLIGLGVVVGLLVVAALVAPGLVDWNRYKSEIAARVEAATGRDLVIAGDLDLSLLPVLRLSAGDVRLANIPGGSSPEMARIKALDIQVRLLPLLQGRFEAEAITLVEPEIVLERLADGRVNWDFAPAGAARGPAAPGAPAGAAPRRGDGAQAIRLDDLRIRRGTVIWRDAVTGTEEKIAGLSAQLSARSLGGPFHAKGEMIVRGVPLAVEAAVGALQPAQAAPVHLLVSVPSTEARAELSGGAVLAGAAPRFTGTLNAGGKDLRRLVAALSATSRTTLPPALAQPFLVRGRIQASQAGGTIDNIEAELGGARATGSVSVSTGERLHSTAQIHVTRIDLDPWLNAKEQAEIPAGAAPGSAGAPAAPTEAAPPAPFTLPDIDATVKARIEAVTWNRQNIRNIDLEASLAGGTARLETLRFLLPGGGEARIAGTLAARGGKPSFDGKVDVQADNLRAMLTWLGADVAAVPSDRLRKFAFSADLKLDDQQLQLLGAKISVDTTRIDGGVTLALRERPAFGATVRFDSLDLDAYLPRGGAAAAKDAKGEGGGAAEGAAPAPAGPLAVLDDFDANLVLQVNRLTASDTTLRDIRFDGTLLGGVMTVRNASIGDVAGASAALSGTVSNFAAVPVFKGTVAADARDSAEILRLAGLTPPASGPLGALRLRGTADASADRVTLDLALDAAGASVKLAGIAAALGSAPRIEATLSAAHGDLARLLATLGVEPPGETLGPLDLSATLKGNLQQLSMTSRIEVAGGTVSATGTVRDLARQPAWNLVVAAAHPSVAALVRRFAPAWRPAGGAIGPLRLNATATGTQSGWTLTALTASAGEVSLQGSGRLETGGARPKLTASLTGGEIDLNPFLPPEGAAGEGGQVGAPGPGGGAGAARAAAERFSSEPFDLSGLRAFDAEIGIGATALVWRQFRIDRPAIAAALADGVLTVKEVAGRMFDGSFRLAGKLDARKVPALEGTVSVQQANIGKALLEAGAFDLEGGIADFTMQVAGDGASPRALVGALNGTGKLAARDGVVRGFDLQAVSDRLKNIDNAVDILTLLGASMQGGETRFSSLDGTFRIDEGVLRSDDLRLVAEAGELRAAGFADLPRWHMDFNGQFRLTEHPKAPPFGMRAVGPIDDPRRIFQFEKLQQYLVQRGIGTMLRKVLPQREDRPATQPPPAQQQQPQEPRRPRLEDILPGILDSLKR